MKDLGKNNQPATIKRIDYSTDHGVGARARLGLLVLESDQTFESEMRFLTNLPEVSLYHARLANDAIVTSETLAKMVHELPIAASLLPKYLGLSAIGYGCTSGATIIGEERVREILSTLHPDVPSTNPLTAARHALHALGISKLGLVTPYTPEVTIAMQETFARDHIEVSAIGSFYEENDVIVGRISEDSIIKAAVEIGRMADVEGVFISCTSLRTAHIIEVIENAIKKPVTSSNHAMAWHLLRLSGINDTLAGFGRLYHLQPKS